MKKLWLFTFSTLIAFAIAYYSKNSPFLYTNHSKPIWKTFVKKSPKEISGHKTTSSELAAARIPEVKREIAQAKDADEKPKQNPDFLYRENRVLIGDTQNSNYQDEQVELVMVNRPSQNWKDILGNDLIRFHDEETKVMIKEEFPVIKVQNGKGQYLEQVVVTYLFTNGNYSSYRALVDSETGFVQETWDKTIHENYRSKRAGISLPLDSDNGIKAK